MEYGHNPKEEDITESGRHEWLTLGQMIDKEAKEELEGLLKGTETTSVIIVLPVAQGYHGEAPFERNYFGQPVEQEYF